MLKNDEPPCLKCDDYQYIGEGCAICEKNGPILVQKDWRFIYAEVPCKKITDWIKEA